MSQSVEGPPGTPRTRSAPPDQGAGSATQGVQLLPLLKQYFKTAGVLLFAWSMGYFRFSSTWILLGMFFYVVNEEYRKVKNAKKGFAQSAVKNEKEAILARIDELPSWVYFPDVERAEWLNKMLKQMWPYIGDYLEDYLKNNIQPMVDNSMPASLKPFRFEQIDLGDIPPRIGGVKVYTEHVKRDEIIMDMEIFYASDSQIKVAVRGMNAGIKDLTLHGTVRIVMKPLVNIVPIIGGMQIFFLNQPSLDFDLTNVANILDIPLLSQSLRTVVEDYVSQFMVLPNKIPITLAKNVQAAMLRNIMPQGVIRIQCVAARELKKADISVFGKGKSDPYLKLYVGATSFKTKVVEDTVNPVWNEFFEAAVDQKHGQFVEIECLDKDPGDDDELGTTSIDIDGVAKTGTMDSWLPLENVQTGMVHVRALWLHLSKDPEDLNRERERTKDRDAGTVERLGISLNQALESVNLEQHLSSAILRVTLDSAKGLPRQKKSMGEPSPFVRMSIGNEVKKSLPKMKTTDPRWEESFLFLVNNPEQQEMLVEVLDSNKNDKKLGWLQVPIRSLLTAKDMIINRPFQLKESGTQTKIVMRLCLRILTSQVPADWAMDTFEDVCAEDDEKAEAQNRPQSPGSSVDPEPLPAATAAGPSSPAKEAGGKENDRNANFVVGGSEESDAPSVETPIVCKVNDSEVQSSVRRRGPATSSSGESPFGKMELTIRYSPQRQKLILVVHRCMNLIPCDDDNLADPYVRIYLLPEKSSSQKRKTQIVKNNLNPQFDETFEWDTNMHELIGKSLDISVKNKNSLFSKKREHMGQFVLPLNNMDLTKANTQWYDIEDPDTKSD